MLLSMNTPPPINTAMLCLKLLLFVILTLLQHVWTPPPVVAELDSILLPVRVILAAYVKIAPLS